MANRETYPAYFSPIQGDVAAGAGATAAVVTGIQTYPVSPATPLDQQILKFIADPSQPHGGTWTPSTLGTSSMIQVNGFGVSDDPEVFVNNLDTLEEMVLPITVNQKAAFVRNASVMVSLFPVSDDYGFFVNGRDQATLVNSTLSMVNKQVYVNGV